MSLTRNGKIVDVNPAWLILHGFISKGEVIGSKVDDLIYPDDLKILAARRKNWPKNLARKYPIRDRRKNGAVVDVEVYSSGIVSYPDLILLDLPEESPLRAPVLTMKRSGQKAAAIVQDLLTLARRGVPLKKVINLNEIIDDYLKSPEHIQL